MENADPKTTANLSCPFCGGAVDPTGWLMERGFPHPSGEQIRGPECSDCGATAPDLATWNRRAEAPSGFERITGAADRADLACRIANRLMDFPLAPQPGDTLDQHAACLEIAYAGEITKALNECADGR